MKKKILSAFLAAAMLLSVAGCNQETGGNSDNTGDSANTGSAANTGDPANTGDEPAPETTVPENVISGDAESADAIVVWMWNTDLQKILDGVLKEVDPDLYKRVVYVNAGGTDYYQPKLDNILKDPSNSLYPDIIALEADYILKYINGSDVMNIADLGITADDYKDAYKYTLDTATNNKGELKALSWQAAPGAWVVNVNAAEKYLGTTDPAAIQDALSSWDKVYETAKKVKEASGGEARLIPGVDDVKRIFMSNRKSAWYDMKASSPKLTIDDTMYEYMDFAKKLYDEELTFNTTQWSDPWVASKEGDKVLALPGCTWYTYWSTAESNFGNYVLVQGPQQYSWGGTWIAGTTGCSDKDAVAKIIKYITCDADFMGKINAMNSDYVNNKTAIDNRISEGAVAQLNGKDILSDKQGESFLSFFKSKVDNINGTLLTDADSIINGAWDTQLEAYCQGKKDKDTAIADFKAAVKDKVAFITVE